MVLVLVDAITPRLIYTLDFIFKERGIDYETTTAQIDFEERDVAFRLNYSTRHSEIAKQIDPCTLLRESIIHDLKLEKTEFEGEECLMIEGKIDPIAAVFYVLSRYEEYGISHEDEHGRFIAIHSILIKYDWNTKVVCDRWAKKIIEFIFPELYLESELRFRLMHPTSLIPTFDIDNAFAYKNKKVGRTVMSIFKDILKGNRSRLKERVDVSRGDKDPYDTYEKIIEVADVFKQTRVFWLVRSNGEKDRNVPLDNEEHQKTIRSVSIHATIGIHPSYGSFGNSDLIRQEKNDLEQVLGKEILASRFHFLRFKLPHSYRNLLDAGIEEDHSMGFAEKIGFRAGTARPFKWFDLEKNEVTDLWVHPFAYMDGTLNEYMNLSTEQSVSIISELYKEVSDFGGDFRFIWHNETINNEGKWSGWQEVLNKTLEL